MIEHVAASCLPRVIAESGYVASDKSSSIDSRFSPVPTVPSNMSFSPVSSQAAPLPGQAVTAAQPLSDAQRDNLAREFKTNLLRLQNAMNVFPRDAPHIDQDGCLENMTHGVVSQFCRCPIYILDYASLRRIA